MTMSHFKKIIDEENNINWAFPTISDPVIAGTYSEIHFLTPPNRDLRVTHETKLAKSQAIQFATGIPLGWNKKVYESQLLLQRNKVPMEFMVNYFYVAETGEKISPPRSI